MYEAEQSAHVPWVNNVTGVDIVVFQAEHRC